MYTLNASHASNFKHRHGGHTKCKPCLKLEAQEMRRGAFLGPTPRRISKHRPQMLIKTLIGWLENSGCGLDNSSFIHAHNLKHKEGYMHLSKECCATATLTLFLVEPFPS